MTDSPNYQDSIYTTAQPKLKKISDVTSGLSEMMQGKYLIKFDLEDDAQYQARYKRSEYNNSVNETIELAQGKIFRKPISYEDVTPQLEEWAQDVTGQSTTLNEWAKHETRKAVRDGLVYCLIDMPNNGDLSSLTDAQLSQLDLKPKLSTVLFSDIQNRIIDDYGNLVQVTIRESVTEQTGRFEQDTVTQYRVIWIEGGEVWQELYREGKDGKVQLWEEATIITPATNARKLVKIPLIPYYTNKTGAHNAEPPLLEQANTLISFYNINSQYTRALTKSGDPTLTMQNPEIDENGRPKPIKLGVNSMLGYSGDNAPEYLEFKGNSLPEYREKLKLLQEELDTYKSDLINKGNTVAVKQVEAENADNASKLTNFAWGLDDYLNGIKEIVSIYLGVENIGMIESNKDFDEYKITENMLEKLSKLELMGQISKRTLLELYKKGEILPDNFDIDSEIDNLSEQPPL